MATNKRIPSPLAIAALVLLAGYILYIGGLALGQFTPKCAAALCPTLIEMTLRAIAVFIAGMMLLAGAGWWIVFNIVPRLRRSAGQDK